MSSKQNIYSNFWNFVPTHPDICNYVVLYVVLPFSWHINFIFFLLSSNNFYHHNELHVCCTVAGILSCTFIRNIPHSICTIVIIMHGEIFAFLVYLLWKDTAQNIEHGPKCLGPSNRPIYNYVVYIRTIQFS